MIVMRNGVALIDRSPFHTEKDDKRFDAKYGIGKWKYRESVCSFLSPECGYGPQLDRNTCSYCDGKCYRPNK